MSSVDVVIPCYNYARYLPQCVASVLHQEGMDLRVLIIDDCSTDESESVGQRLAHQDRRVEYRRHSTNRGHIATYNEGLLGWADGDYVLLLSADDMLALGALSRAARTMNAAPNVSFCYGQQIVFENQPPISVNDGALAVDIMKGQDFIEMLCTGGDNPVSTPTAVVRTAVQKRAGGYKPELPHAGDLEMWLRCAAYGDVARLNMVQAFKREHPKNMVKQFAPTFLPDLQQRKLAFDSAVCEWAGRIDDAGGLRDKAYKALAGHAFWAAHVLFERGETALCNRLLEFALELDPSWLSKAEWQRFLWKRRVSPKLWGAARPLIELLRRLA